MSRKLLLILATLLPLILIGQSICQIQGSGAASAYDGQLVTAEGIVTAVYTGTGSLNGYFIEQPDCDGNAATSDGIFVYDPTPGAIAVGQRVSVTGVVDEFNGVTEITTASSTLVGTEFFVPTQVELPLSASIPWERYEGMYLRFPGTLTVTDNGDWVRYGELYLSPQRLINPTQLVDPNDALPSGTTSSGMSNAAAVISAADLNERSYILLDDARTNAYPTPLLWADVNGSLRAGSTITDLEGVLHSAYGAYRLEPVGALEFDHAARPAVPEVGGAIRAASLNVLNYFATLGDWGAANAGELDRQRTKLVSAMQAMDADVLALCELENTDEAWNHLLDGLNAEMGAGTYAGMEEDGFGNGTRTVIFYKPAVLTPVTQLYWLNTNIFQRPHLTQGFEVNATGSRFLFSTMHLRSKLCDNATGEDLDQGDGQGCYNALRRSQASALVQHWSGIRSSTGISAQLIMGDYNAYTEEDPLDVFRASGLVDLVSPSEHTHSYLGTFGALDHAFATAAMENVVTGSAVWHINSDEPEALDYRDGNLSRYQPNAFRCSDHDPVIVGFSADPVGLSETADEGAVQVLFDGVSARWNTQGTGPVQLELYNALGGLLRSSSAQGYIGADLSNVSPGVVFWRLNEVSSGEILGTGRLVVGGRP